MWICWECECLVTCPSTHFSLDCWLCGWWWWWWSVSFCCSCSNFFFINSLFPYHIISMTETHIPNSLIGTIPKQLSRVGIFLLSIFIQSKILFRRVYIIHNLCCFFVLMFPAPNIIFFFFIVKKYWWHIYRVKDCLFFLCNLFCQKGWKVILSFLCFICYMMSWWHGR